MAAAEESRSPATSTGSGYTLFDALQRVVDAHATSVAVRCGTDAWTYGELRDRAVRLGNAWRAAGVAAGARVAVLSDNCHRYVEVYWAAAYSGAVVVPIEGRLGDDEIRAIVDEAAPVVAVAGGAVELATLQRVAPSIALVILGRSDAQPAPRDMASEESATGRERHQATVDYEQLLAGSSAHAAEGGVEPDDPVALYFTAAVEGRARGAVVTHRNLLVQAVQTAEAIDLGLEDAQGVFLPLSHTFGGYLMFVAACRGSTNTLLASFDPVVAANLIGAGEVTWFAGFAPMPARIADAAAAAGLSLAGGPGVDTDGGEVRATAGGTEGAGGRLRLVLGLDSPTSIQRYLDLGVRWYNFYGQTETAGLVTVGEVTRDHVVADNVGRPLRLTRVSLRDQEGRPAPAGEAGEAWVRSDAVVERYWFDQPTRLTDDGWLRTGDVLRGGAQGELYFVGRTTDKDLIKPGGLNVYPVEVETLLATHPGVRRAWVFGLPDPTWRERVCAVVVAADPAHPPSEDALRAHCRARAAAFKCPQQVVVAADLPDGLTRGEARDRYGPALSQS